MIVMNKLNSYTEIEERDFIESLYDDANEQLEEIYSEQKKNKDNLLKELALVLLAYQISNNVMELSDDDKKKLNNNFLLLIAKFFKKQVKVTDKVITNILNNTAKNTYDFYGQKYKSKDIEDIINKKYKGEIYNKRIEKNENKIANKLNNDIKDFIEGIIDVNSIKGNIEETFSQNAYDVHRLAESEVNRTENDSFMKIAKANGVKKIIRHEVLDNKICLECLAISEKTFDIDKAPDGAIHSFCRGWNSIYEEKEN